MNQAEPDAAYSQVAKIFHWLVVALLVVQFTIAWTMPDVGRGTRPVGLVGWHLTVGTTILAVVALRFVWRLTHPAPSPPSDLPTALALVSRATHYGLYALLFVLPLIGWANASARDWPVKLFGFIPLPHLVQAGSPLGRQMGDIHATTALVLLGLIALHVTGALYHGFYLRDRTLQRML